MTRKLLSPSPGTKRPWRRGKAAALAAATVFALLAPLPAAAEYWEDPTPVAEGRFPSLFLAKAGPVLVWQESVATGDDTGSSRVRFARYDGGEWIRGVVSPSAYAYSSAGAPPLVYSAAQSKSGAIAVAIAASGTKVEIRISRDGGRSFEAAGELDSATTSVAPRIYPSASGGWLVFLTRGSSSAVQAVAGTAGAAGTAAEGASQGTQVSSVSIYVARSPDGQSWSRIEPLVSDDERLPMNFAPAVAPLGSRDLVVFQTFVLGEGDQSSRYVLMAKTSSDGGATWTKARAFSDFDADAKAYDNQGPQLVSSGGRIYAAWERRRTKSTQTQVWVARVDQSGAAEVRTAKALQQGASGSFMLASILDSGGSPSVISREDKLKANRVTLSTLGADGQWSSQDAGLAARGEGAGVGLIAFARAIESGKRSFVAWQLDTTDRSRILAMVPDVGVAPPTLLPVNFAAGRRSRSEIVEARLALPKDEAGITGYAFVWRKTPDKAAKVEAPSTAEIWRLGEKREARRLGLELPANQDGAWTLWASVEDGAGNRSAPAALSYYRKMFPPPPPALLQPELDDRGFLASSTFGLRWTPPDADDVAGYSWELAYAGPLEEDRGPAAEALGATAVKASAQAGAGARAASADKSPGGQLQAAVQGRIVLPSLGGLSPYEAALVRPFGSRTLPPIIRGSVPAFSADNVENGYYLFSVSAVDTTGNVSQAASILLKANKFRPYTTLALAETSRDELGRSALKLLGRGFLAEGRIERVAMSRSTAEPYDVEWDIARGEYRIASDREIDGLAFDDAPAGAYRIGLYHSGRGWYWSAPVVAVDESGTIKYGFRPEYAPGFRPLAGLGRNFSIYDAMAILAMLFAAVGILLSSRQVVAVAREGEFVRREAAALITGGAMPQAEKSKAIDAVARRGVGLRTKFTLTIAFLVIFVVLLLSIFLGYNMIRRTGAEMAMELDQRAKVLLESVAQGGRFFIGKEDAVTQLSIFPSQARAMAGANYITITAQTLEGKAGGSEVVFATSDAKIADKLETSTLSVDRAVVLGRSILKVDGGDPLAKVASAKAADFAEKATFIVADQLKQKESLAKERDGLKRDAAGNSRRTEINAQLDSIDVKVREKLASLSDQEVGTFPAFDPESLGRMPPRYLYYKPIVEYRPGDQNLYRGMVRLEVSTSEIKQEVADSAAQLVRLTLIIAAFALAIGIAGAFILSSAIVRPIRQLVKQIERIRDTEDKEELEGSRIEVKSRDELYDLAETVNQMTQGLVSAAKASKELILGKGIQKMFIPLDPAPGTKTKLSTGRRDEKDFEVYGYYEGADAVSGDYWDFRSINQRYHYFIKCDVSGHGVSAALIMVQVATIVINYFNGWKQAMPKAIDLTDLAYKINDFLEERQFVGRFAAFTLGVWDSREGIAYLCDAGDKILHVWDDEAGKLLVEELPDSPAAGPLASILIQMKQPFKQVVRKLRPDDILFLYTDGIEESKRYFRDPDYAVVTCGAVAKDEEHGDHKGGENNEEFGFDRLSGLLEAYARRGQYRLTRQHDPAESVLTFDFSSCTGSLEEKIIAPLAVEKVYRFYRDPPTTEKDVVIVDKKIDDFLKLHFDQYRLYCSDWKENDDPNNPGYVLYGNLKSDPQWDDLTLLGIRRK